MTYRKRETMKDFARYMASKYATIERLRKQDAERRAGESAPAMTKGSEDVRDYRVGVDH